MCEAKQVVEIQIIPAGPNGPCPGVEMVKETGWVMPPNSNTLPTLLVDINTGRVKPVCAQLGRNNICLKPGAYDESSNREPAVCPVVMADFDSYFKSNAGEVETDKKSEENPQI